LRSFVAENLPKVAAGLLVPLAQFLWQLLQRQRYEHRKAILRKKIAELSDQRESLTRFALTPTALGALRDLETELAGAIDQLAQLTAARSAVRVQQPATRGFLANWFLLYVPSGVRAWCLHVLFFVILSIIVFGLIGVAVDWKTDPNSSDALIGFGVFALVGLGVRALARKLDRKTRQRISIDSAPGDLETALASGIEQPAHLSTAKSTALVQRPFWASWFLLYVPSGVGAWCVHILFYLIVCLIVFGAIGVAAEWDTDPDRSAALLGFGIFALAGLGLRAIARKLDRKTQRLNAHRSPAASIWFRRLRPDALIRRRQRTRYAVGLIQIDSGPRL